MSSWSPSEASLSESESISTASATTGIPPADLRSSRRLALRARLAARLAAFSRFWRSRPSRSWRARRRRRSFLCGQAHARECHVRESAGVSRSVSLT